MHRTAQQHDRSDQEDPPRLGQRTHDRGNHETTGDIHPIQFLSGTHGFSLLSSGFAKT
jgi:hypothetical protein